MLQELVIKVPAPFLGSPDIGFSTRYPAQETPAPQRDVPFIIEGPPKPMRLLQSRLELFRQKRLLIPETPDEAYSWTDLIPLNDELFILAFRDESWRPEVPLEPADHLYLTNLIRPLLFPFLKDCVRIGQLALRDRIDFAIVRDAQVLAELGIRRDQVVADNGSIVLWDLS